jgi:hypothetical protein
MTSMTSSPTSPLKELLRMKKSFFTHTGFSVSPKTPEVQVLGIQTKHQKTQGTFLYRGRVKKLPSGQRSNYNLTSKRKFAQIAYLKNV